MTKLNRLQNALVDLVGYSGDDVAEMSNEYIIEHSKELEIYNDLLNLIE